jgi:hypothetical protein
MSRIDAVTTTVDVPSATTVGALTVQLRLAGGPNTLTGAEALDAPATATTLQGCDGALIAVAAKSPVVVTAPQPPMTLQVLALDAMNWNVEPTGTEADAGVMASVDAAGAVFVWKYPDGRNSAPVGMRPTSPKNVALEPGAALAGTTKL